MENEQIQTRIDYNRGWRGEYIEFYIQIQDDMKLSLLITRGYESERVSFELSPQKWIGYNFDHMSFESTKVRIDDIWFYIEKIEEKFEKWICSQKDIRLQYLLNPSSILEENSVMEYIKKSKKGLL